MTNTGRAQRAAHTPSSREELRTQLDDVETAEKFDPNAARVLANALRKQPSGDLKQRSGHDVTSETSYTSEPLDLPPSQLARQLGRLKPSGEDLTPGELELLQKGETVESPQRTAREQFEELVGVIERREPSPHFRLEPMAKSVFRTHTQHFRSPLLGGSLVPGMTIRSDERSVKLQDGTRVGKLRVSVKQVKLPMWQWPIGVFRALVGKPFNNTPYRADILFVPNRGQAIPQNQEVNEALRELVSALMNNVG